MSLLNNPLLKIALPPIVLIAIHVFAIEIGVYSRFRWFDTPMHLLGGILVAISVVYLLNYFTSENKLNINSNILKVLIIISVTVLFAFSWEVIEYLADFYLKTRFQASLSDTMKDLCMGFIGGMITSLLHIIKKHTV